MYTIERQTGTRLEMDMPQKRKPPRLFLRNDDGRKSWVILDAGRSFRTGFLEGDRDAAEARLREYIDGTYRPNSTVHYIYYVSATNSAAYPVKIGYTSGAISLRMRTFQCGNPNILSCLATEVGTPELERKRHRQFRHLHIRGEWYERGADLMTLIESLQAARIYV